ncbi:MAG: D-alanyl-D-alanine carboxypeptidase, partial [Parcubacteria group bacterium]|nr:D-alanyl-D-alanine carboxypeptidase [Parcubacteria group bacterium]
LKSEQFYSVRSDASSVVYPFRNWEIKDDPVVQAKGVLLVDIDSDFVFFQNQPNVRRPIASVTKLMTALVAKKYIPADEEITITEESLKVDGDAPIFYLNEKVTANDLIRAMMIISSNKAAMALANHLGQDKFVSLMNEMAKQLEMTQTSYAEPTGLSFLNQSSPTDLKKLIKYIVTEYPNLLLIAQNSVDKIQGKSPDIIHELTNINLIAHHPPFLDELNITYLGGKTGFTDEALQTFCGLFLVPSKRENEQPKRILVVVLGTPNRYNDIENLLKWLDKAYVF